jgi:hypothetical protein
MLAGKDWKDFQSCLATNRGFLGISLVEKCFFTTLCNFFTVNPKVAQCGHAVPVKNQLSSFRKNHTHEQNTEFGYIFG